LGGGYSTEATYISFPVATLRWRAAVGMSPGKGWSLGGFLGQGSDACRDSGFRSEYVTYRKSKFLRISIGHSPRDTRRYGLEVSVFEVVQSRASRYSLRADDGGATCLYTVTAVTPVWDQAPRGRSVGLQGTGLGYFW